MTVSGVPEASSTSRAVSILTASKIIPSIAPKVIIVCTIRLMLSRLPWPIRLARAALGPTASPTIRLTKISVDTYNIDKTKMTCMEDIKMKKSVTLEEALKRIEELEKENAELREELEYYRNRKLSGRQKHNAKWMAIYNDFVIGYESGKTMVEIAKRNNVSERTIYRYKAYYDKTKEKED